MQPKPTLEEILAKVMEPTYEMLRAQHMGWTFGEPEIRERPGLGWALTVSFTCVCGRKEFLTQHAHEVEYFWNFNAPQWLYRHGSFDRDHLQGDGFTEAEIQEIERKGEEFDRITRDHVVVQALRGQWPDDYDLAHARKVVMEVLHAR